MSNHRTVPIRDKAFCTGCRNECLLLHTESIRQADGGYEHAKYVSCRHLSVCSDLYERTVSQFESEADDDTYQDERKLIENDDYSFCSDATYEDMQI